MRQSRGNAKMQTRIIGKLYTLFVAVRIFKRQCEYTYIPETLKLTTLQSHPKETRDDFQSCCLNKKKKKKIQENSKKAACRKWKCLLF